MVLKRDKIGSDKIKGDKYQRFAFVKLSRWDFAGFRLLGPGLGNLLFPWARAIVAAQTWKLTVIWPTWPQVKIGPLLRQEADTRFYNGLFQNPGNYIAGKEKLRLMLTGRRIDERQLNNRVDSMQKIQRPELFVFNGMRGLFSPLVDHRELIRSELLRIARPEHKIGLSHNFDRSISVHVRLGDFAPADEALLRNGEFNVQLPFDWIMDSIYRLRHHLGHDTPVWLFSDGNDKQLRRILQIPAVKRIGFGSALADMLAMSCSSILIPSSTFSLWASFLGGMPTVYYPGQLRQRLSYGENPAEIVREPSEGLTGEFLNFVGRHRRWRPV